MYLLHRAWRRGGAILARRQIAYTCVARSPKPWEGMDLHNNFSIICHRNGQLITNLTRGVVNIVCMKMFLQGGDTLKMRRRKNMYFIPYARRRERAILARSQIAYTCVVRSPKPWKGTDLPITVRLKVVMEISTHDQFDQWNTKYSVEADISAR